MSSGSVTLNHANGHYQTLTITADTTFKVYNVDAITGTSVNGDGVFISSDDSTAGKAAYIVCRVNYLRPAAAVSWSDVSSFVDFASQVGGTDS